MTLTDWHPSYGRLALLHIVTLNYIQSNHISKHIRVLYKKLFRVERFPSHGQYDLKIKNTTYNRDNGNFNCMVKEAGTGKTLHTKSIGLTVLLKPSPPRIFPVAPVAIEGLTQKGLKRENE